MDAREIRWLLEHLVDETSVRDVLDGDGVSPAGVTRARPYALQLALTLDGLRLLRLASEIRRPSRADAVVLAADPRQDDEALVWRLPLGE